MGISKALFETFSCFSRNCISAQHRESREAAAAAHSDLVWVFENRHKASECSFWVIRSFSSDFCKVQKSEKRYEHMSHLCSNFEKNVGRWCWSNWEHCRGKKGIYIPMERSRRAKEHGCIEGRFWQWVVFENEPSSVSSRQVLIGLRAGCERREEHVVWEREFLDEEQKRCKVMERSKIGRQLEGSLYPFPKQVRAERMDMSVTHVLLRLFRSWAQEHDAMTVFCCDIKTRKGHTRRGEHVCCLELLWNRMEEDDVQVIPIEWRKKKQILIRGESLCTAKEHVSWCMRKWTHGVAAVSFRYGRKTQKERET